MIVYNSSVYNQYMYNEKRYVGGVVYYAAIPNLFSCFFAILLSLHLVRF